MSLFSKLFNKKKTIVHLLRGGAGDKCMYNIGGSNSNYITMKHDHTNLKDIPIEVINEWTSRGEWIIPCDEADILYANQHQSEILHPELIIMPQDKYHKFIPYDYVHKGGIAYEKLTEKTGIKFPKSQEYTLDEFKRMFGPGSGRRESTIQFEECAIKTTTGSGSRGVYICSTEAVNNGWEGNYHPNASYSDLKQIINFTQKEIDTGLDCKIVIEELIPVNLRKVICDFTIRDGRLQGYSWKVADWGENFTFFWKNNTLRTNETDAWMQSLSNYLINELGVHDGILDFEGFQSDYCNTLWLCEINWRWCGCEEFYYGKSKNHYDIGRCYIERVNWLDMIPRGSTRVVRYWYTIVESDIPNIGEGYEYKPKKVTLRSKDEFMSHSYRFKKLCK